uniref:Uncharacterized protein n=1 Tax=Chromera velia CCMP2878 TaxID=1169474 RepID=A0A0G4GGP5_9ALVE|eukprot:Cvel_21822.t1-p1 / transcript=Cvel_21822.t1 / gene=Cvel_21822 / organism=Chromera_velia_CCMP2878 / gene_product=hypothetical protein / transcript_product=hypothetical protein / location=Cvel_scaffold2081:16108-21793(-) / protein_length=489 / sequence_SO=supercontig / SO=protein_coding / is_pseudo=false
MEGHRRRSASPRRLLVLFCLPLLFVLGDGFVSLSPMRPFRGHFLPRRERRWETEEGASTLFGRKKGGSNKKEPSDKTGKSSKRKSKKAAEETDKEEVGEETREKTLEEFTRSIQEQRPEDDVYDEIFYAQPRGWHYKVNSWLPYNQLAYDMLVADSIPKEAVAQFVKNGVELVVQLSQDWEEEYQDYSKEVKENGGKYLHLPITEMTWTKANVEKVLQTIRAELPKSLLLIDFGMFRSAAIGGILLDKRKLMLRFEAHHRAAMVHYGGAKLMRMYYGHEEKMSARLPKGHTRRVMGAPFEEDRVEHLTKEEEDNDLTTRISGLQSKIRQIPYDQELEDKFKRAYPDYHPPPRPAKWDVVKWKRDQRYLKQMEEAGTPVTVSEDYADPLGPDDASNLSKRGQALRWERLGKPKFDRITWGKQNVRRGKIDRSVPLWEDQSEHMMPTLPPQNRTGPYTWKELMENRELSKDNIINDDDWVSPYDPQYNYMM